MIREPKTLEELRNSKEFEEVIKHLSKGIKKKPETYYFTPPERFEWLKRLFRQNL